MTGFGLRAKAGLVCASMNLARLLKNREQDGKPIRVGLIGCGKFGTMFASQARITSGIHLTAVADINPGRVQHHLRTAGWPASQTGAKDIGSALQARTTFITDTADILTTHTQLDVIIEATGDPVAGIAHALQSIENGKHIVMVNVEADALAGPLLAKRAHKAGVVYSLAYGDQPALICEQVDWARACGFDVVAAGKGTRYIPSYHALTPDTVWQELKKYLRIDDPNSINLNMFNSFLDGTKSAIEMTAVANACSLQAQSGGLQFPPASRFELAEVCKPQADGGHLAAAGVTEVVSSLNRDGTEVPHHVAMGTFVVVTSKSSYARQCFRDYNCLPDSTGQYAALYRPTHMIGLELGISIASVVLRHEPTGTPQSFNSDAVAIAKRNIRAGEVLDGEGGFMVWAKQLPAKVSIPQGFLPIGLAKGLATSTNIVQGEPLRWSDLVIDHPHPAILFRREMERQFGPAGS